MKLPTLLLLGLTALTHATPVILHDRAQVSAAQIDDAATKLDALAAKVDTLSASISNPPLSTFNPSTLGANPVVPDQTIATHPSTTDSEKDALADAVAPQLADLETALAEATALIEGGAAAQKRSSSSSEIGPRTTSCSDACLTGKANGLVVVISGTVSGLVGCLGVGEYPVSWPVWV